MRKSILVAAILCVAPVILADEPVSVADMSDTARKQTYGFITAYNKCMMESRLKHSQDGKATQQNAQDIMNDCESHIDSLTLHLSENHVDTALIEGMTKRLRSQAARHLMARAMNGLAAQAAAIDNTGVHD